MVTGVTDGVSDLIKPSNNETNGFGKVCLHRWENLTDWTLFGYCVESLGELGTCKMISRDLSRELLQQLKEYPVVTLLGPR